MRFWCGKSKDWRVSKRESKASATWLELIMEERTLSYTKISWTTLESSKRTYWTWNCLKMRSCRESTVTKTHVRKKAHALRMGVWIKILYPGPDDSDQEFVHEKISWHKFKGRNKIVLKTRLKRRASRTDFVVKSHWYTGKLLQEQGKGKGKGGRYNDERRGQRRTIGEI